MTRQRGLVVIVTYQSESTIGECLSAVHLARTSAVRTWDVKVFDNASSDATCAEVERSGVAACLVSHPTNIGFSAGVNMAVGDAADYDMLLLLNPDCFVAPDALLACERWLEDRPRDTAHVQLLNMDGTIQPSAGLLPFPTRLVRNRLRGLRRSSQVYLNEPTKTLASEPRAVEWAHLAFLMLPADLFRRLGGLDERFFMFGEDTDFCLRLRQAGSAIWWIPEGASRHVMAVSRRQFDFRDDNPTLVPSMRWLQKHGHHGQLLLFRAGLVGLSVAEIVGGFRRGASVAAGVRTLKLAFRRLCVVDAESG